MCIHPNALNFPILFNNLSLVAKHASNCAQSVAWGSDCTPTQIRSPCFPLVLQAACWGKPVLAPAA